ncbi:MAG: hypothetical protein ACKO5F_02680 [Synechococcus sp.]
MRKALTLLVSLVAASACWANEAPLPLSRGKPIVEAHAALLARGWLAQPDHQPEPYERELAGNQLPSLSSCSQSGPGFCRYDYGRGGQRLVVITVPSDAVHPSKGIVQQWWLE